MEIYASGNIRAGDVTVKLATAGRICPITDRAYRDPQLVCYRHVIPGLWYPGTATKTCAQSMRWYRDVFGRYEALEGARQNMNAYTLIGNEAAEVPAGSDNLFFHPYLQGELTPYQNTALRASFTGIASSHTKAHFNRAVMEGVAYSMKDCLNVLKRLNIPIGGEFKIIGGGSKSPLWRQIVSDVLNLPLLRVTTDDSSIGSAMLAGVASGVFSSFEESVAMCSKTAETIYPTKENALVYETGFRHYKEIQAALALVYDRLHGAATQP
jgi:xylulokinase